MFDAGKLQRQQATAMQKTVPNPNGQPPMLKVGELIEMPSGVRCRVVYVDECRAYVRPTVKKDVDGEISDMNAFSISPYSHVKHLEN